MAALIPCMRCALYVVAGVAAFSDTAVAQEPKVPRLTLAPELRIGGGNVGPAYEFTEITQVAARGGTVYVLQKGEQEIRMFDSSGRHLRTIGRRGGGPGEFEALQSFGLLRDTLWSIDANLRRVSLFTVMGKLLATIPFESATPKLSAGGKFFFSYPMALLRDGTVLGFGGTAASAIAAGLVTTAPILRLTRSGRTIDTLGWVSVRNADMILRSAKATMYRKQPFTDVPLTVYAATAERVYVVERQVATTLAPNYYRVTAIRPNGETAWVKRYAYTPIRLEPSVADSVRRSLGQALRHRFPQQEIDRAMFVPAFQTPITGGIAGEDGTLWLRREDTGDSVEYAVLGDDGEERARVRVARQVQLKWVSGSTAWGAELDDNDVPALVRYRVVANRDSARR